MIPLFLSLPPGISLGTSLLRKGAGIAYRVLHAAGGFRRPVTGLLDVMLIPLFLSLPPGISLGTSLLRKGAGIAYRVLHAAGGFRRPVTGLLEQ